MIDELASVSIDETFWRLSWRVCVPAIRRGVMAWLWLMPCPVGLARTDEYKSGEVKKWRKQSLK